MFLQAQSVSIGIFFSVVAAASQVNSSCDLNWLFIDIHYRAVDARPDALSYGLFIGAGANSQNQSLWPSITNSETRLATNDFCGPQSPENCRDYRINHGHFGADSSSSWRTTPQYTSLDATAQDMAVNTTCGQDNLNLFSHYFDPSPATKHVVPNHPITLLSDYRSQQDVFFHSGSLGLGSSSTVLKHMVDQGLISRPVVGFHLGTAYPRAGGSQNGSVVFGGYDAGKIESAAHEYRMVESPSPGISPFKVHVKQFSLMTSDGSKIGLVTDDGFDGYISTSQYAMELPRSITKSLAAAMGATPAGNAEDTMVLSKKFDGNITITLDDGYEITYPTDWVSNTSNLTPFSASSMNINNTANNTSNDEDHLVFGAAFLHHLYMTIDYDATKFSLANAKMYNNYVQPQALCPGTIPLAMPEPQINRFTQTGMIGAILGGVIGGIGLLWFAFFVIRKTLQYKQSKDAISRLEDGDDQKAQPKKSSLRTRTKRTFVRFSANRQVKEITPRFVKRVSFTDSDSSSLKEVVLTVTKKHGRETKEGIEMSDISGKSRTRSNSSPVPSTRLSTADTLQESPQAGAQIIQQTAIMQPLPTPNRFANPYAPSPGPTPMTAETPHTGNPLLRGFRNKFQNYEDDDDSDLPQDQRQHKRSGSEQLRKDLGLKLDTSLTARKGTPQIPVDVTAARTSRYRPAPLPLRTGGAPKSSKNEADYVKKNPVRALFGFGPESRIETRPSGLRKMFPPPQ